MTWRVKSIFGPTLQGEGLHAGMPCLFVRLAGCNAWDGRPETRAVSACPYCDTDFRGGEVLTWDEIARRLDALLFNAGLGGRREAPVAGGGHPPALREPGARSATADDTGGRRAAPLAGGDHPPAPREPGARSATANDKLGCVLTGGEPLLQADAALLAALGGRFAWVDIETNGTRPCPPRPANVFLSCSPKAVRGQPIVLDPDWWKVLIPDQESFLEHALASGKPVFVQPTAPDAGPDGPQYRAHLERCLRLCYDRGCRLSLQLHKYIGID